MFDSRKQSKPMHTVRLPLQVTKADRELFGRRFYALSHVHNVCVRHAQKLLHALDDNKTYRKFRKEYLSIRDKKDLTPEDKRRKTELSRAMADIRKDMGLTDAAFQKYLAVCGRQFKSSLTSQQVQKEASRVYSAVEKVLFGNGKNVRFKKYRDFSTIGGKSNKNGVVFHKDTRTITWLGESYPVVMPKDDDSYDYVTESMDADIAYCELTRLMFASGWRYYVTIVFRGPAPKRALPVPDKEAGLDPGVSTMAAVSDEEACLFELAPDVSSYNKRIAELSVRLDRSKRASNPGKYKPDGTIDKTNHDPWTFSRTYRKTRDYLKSLYRQKAAYIRESHRKQVIRLLAMAKVFFAETMSWTGLAKRSKQKTKRSGRTCVIRGRSIRLCVRKKRFGRSMNNRAPGRFLAILDEKARRYGGGVVWIDTKSFRASQYDHAADTYTKVPLTQRSKVVDGQTVQRDLYSAFLLRNTAPTLDHTDREKCLAVFRSFLRVQNACIRDMKARGESMPQCFGF